MHVNLYEVILFQDADTLLTYRPYSSTISQALASRDKPCKPETYRCVTYVDVYILCELEKKKQYAKLSINTKVGVWAKNDVYPGPTRAARTAIITLQRSINNRN